MAEKDKVRYAEAVEEKKAKDALNPESGEAEGSKVRRQEIEERRDGGGRLGGSVHMCE